MTKRRVIGRRISRPRKAARGSLPNPAITDHLRALLLLLLLLSSKWIFLSQQPFPQLASIRARVSIFDGSHPRCRFLDPADSRFVRSSIEFGESSPYESFSSNLLSGAGRNLATTATRLVCSLSRPHLARGDAAFAAARRVISPAFEWISP